MIIEGTFDKTFTEFAKEQLNKEIDFEFGGQKTKAKVIEINDNSITLEINDKKINEEIENEFNKSPLGLSCGFLTKENEKDDQIFNLPDKT